MTLRGVISTVPDGIKGFDCNQVLSVGQIKAFVDNGFKFVVRYIPRVTRADNDLTNAEAQRILDNKLALSIVQHVSAENWVAGPDKGKLYGNTAVSQVLDIGMPLGVNIWLDLEGIDPKTDTKDDVGIIAFCKAWYTIVASAGYKPGIYCGWHTLLTGTQLYNLPFKSYWRAYNLNKDQYPVPRGFQMLQGYEKVLSGVRYDSDISQVDNNGDRAVMLWPLV